MSSQKALDVRVFGASQRFVGSERGSALSLRGINAWVVKGAEVRVGDEVVALFD